MDTKALRPGSFFENLPSLVKEKKAKEKGMTEEEQLLYALSQSGGWKILKEYAESLTHDLDNGTTIAMAQGLPFEEIGRNAVVIDLAKGIIKRLLEKVEDAKEAAEDGEQ